LSAERTQSELAAAKAMRACTLMDANLAIPSVDDLGVGGLENWLIAQISRREAQRLMPPPVPAIQP
jgi:hypothetical protein